MKSDDEILEMDVLNTRRQFARYIVLALGCGGAILIASAWAQQANLISGLTEDMLQLVAWCIVAMPLFVLAGPDADSRPIRYAVTATFAMVVVWRLIDVSDEVERLRSVPLIGGDSAFHSGLQSGWIIVLSGLTLLVFFLLFDRLITINAKLRESSEHLTNLFDNMPVVCFTFDSECRILSWNRAAEQSYGYTDQEAVGASIHDLIATPETKASTDQVIADVFAGRSVVNARWHDRNKDGQLGWRMGNAFPLFRADGSVECGVNMNVDITEYPAAPKMRCTPVRSGFDARSKMGRWGWRSSIATTSWNA